MMQWGFPRWVCVGAILIGVVALTAQCAVDIYQGTSGFTGFPHSPAFWAQAGQMSLPTGFMVVFGTLAGCCFRSQYPKLGCSLYVVVAFCMWITVSNGQEFLTQQTIAPIEAARAKQAEAKDIADIQNNITLQERKEKLDNLWRTYTTAKDDKTKREVMSQIKEASKDPVALQQAERVAVASGGFIARWLGLHPEWQQEVKAALVPVVIAIGKALAITLGFAFYPTRGQLPIPSGSRQSKVYLGSNIGKFSPAEARADIVKLVVTGALDDAEVTAADFSRRWGVSKPTAGDWIGKFNREKIVTLVRGRKGNQLLVKPAPKPSVHVNGNGAAHAHGNA
jgi:hypothetical protein